LIWPVCLPEEPNSDADTYKNNLAHILGWGSSADINSKASAELKWANIKVYSQRFDFWAFNSILLPEKVYKLSNLGV
jgi:hypothetical protein